MRPTLGARMLGRISLFRPFARSFATAPAAPPPVVSAGYKAIKVFDGKKVVRAYEGKLNNSFKRAGALMNQLDQELVEHVRKTYNRPQWDDVNPGDAVEILYKETGASTRSQTASGVVIATKRKNEWNASAKVMAVIGTNPIEYHFPLNSPLVSHVRLVQSAFIHKGRKRVKRAKLYYMRTRPIGELRTPPSEITKEEREKALIVARRVSAEAKMGKKEKEKQKKA